TLFPYTTLFRSVVAGATSARGAGAALPRLCGAHRAAAAIARRHQRHRSGLAAPRRRAGRSGAHAPRRRDRAHLAVCRLRRPLSRPGRVPAIARRLAAATGSRCIGRRGMKHRGLLVAALVLLGAAVLVGLFLATFQRRDLVEPTPASGAAQTNPLFALEQTLRDMGEPAASLTTLDPRQVPLRPGDTVLVGADAGRIDADTAARLVAWVRQGGHLLLAPDAGARAPVFAA